MTKDDAKHLVKTVRGIFPTVTPEQGTLLADWFEPYNFQHALAVVKTHRAQHEFLDFPQLHEALKAAEESRKQRISKGRSGRILDWLITTDTRYRSMNPIEALQRHFSACRDSITEAVTAGNREQGIPFSLATARMHARWAFMEIELSEQDATELADEIFGPLASPTLAIGGAA